jgi:hypothetical protein
VTSEAKNRVEELTSTLFLRTLSQLKPGYI